VRDTARRKGWEVPAEVAESLVQRNAKPTSLRGWGFAEGIAVADLGPTSDLVSRTPPEYPDAKAYAIVFLPGYSKDGRTAVVQFDFGPTPHGASATYLLVRTEGGWTVTQSALVYYA
jgi:hypothetical protein